MPVSVVGRELSAGAELALAGDVRFTTNATMAGCVENEGVPDGDTEDDEVSDWVCDDEPDCEMVCDVDAVGDSEEETLTEGMTEGLTEELAVTELETGTTNGPTVAESLTLATRRRALLFLSATTTPTLGMTAMPAGL